MLKFVGKTIQLGNFKTQKKFFELFFTSNEKKIPLSNVIVFSNYSDNVYLEISKFDLHRYKLST